MTYLVNFKIEYISLIVKHLSDISRRMDLIVYDFYSICKTETCRC